MDRTDDALLDEVQRQTFGYFWDGAHPVSGLALDRRTRGKPGNDVAAIGGSGFGIMALLVAAERGWIARGDMIARLRTILDFLAAADRFHGIYPHFMDGATGRVVPFSPRDDGADLVETAFLFQGLLCARQYCARPDPAEAAIRDTIEQLWRDADWAWHTRGRPDALYWHWSPNHGWAMDFYVRGWNECLIAYVLGASSPTCPISAEVYRRAWATGPDFRNGRDYYGITLPLGPDFGGPLFFAHYSFLGLDPRGLSDVYADYWAQNVAHCRINYEHCVRNPNGFRGYGPDCWGLTASDSVDGYRAHSPTNDVGVISPTAAAASLPYVPDLSLRAMRNFRGPLGDRLWGEYGFADAFSPTADWCADTFLAIDQGPIVIMIENHRSGLLWRLFMSCPEVQAGLRRLGFAAPALA